MMRTLLGGRLRTSTLALVVLFAGLLVLYAWARPETVSTPPSGDRPPSATATPAP